MLLEEFDPQVNAVIDPEMVTSRLENFPEVTVSCFSKKLFELPAGPNFAAILSPLEIFDVMNFKNRFFHFAAYFKAKLVFGYHGRKHHRFHPCQSAA